MSSGLPCDSVALDILCDVSYEDLGSRGMPSFFKIPWFFVLPGPASESLVFDTENGRSMSSLDSALH